MGKDAYAGLRQPLLMEARCCSRHWPRLERRALQFIALRHTGGCRPAVYGGTQPRSRRPCAFALLLGHHAIGRCDVPSH
jgi:hypothetical protein